MVGQLRTIQEVELRGKCVLLRADYNVPLKSDGSIADDYRIRQSLPTINYILKQEPARLIIISHLGRPKSAQDKQLSLKPVAKRLSTLLDRSVHLISDCVGQVVKDGLKASDSKIVMLENLRFHPEEEKNDLDFAKDLIESTGAEVFIADGFGVVHRAHASTDAAVRLLPAAAGLLVEKEVEAISSVMDNPKRPLVAVIGGAKIADKIEVIKRFIEIADCVAVGGALANDFLKAQNIKVGASLYDQAELGLAREILALANKTERKRNFTFLVPVDSVVSTSDGGKLPTRVVELSEHVLSDIEYYPKLPPAKVSNVASDEKILDIGPVSAARISGAVNMAATVVWSGTLGMAEVPGIAGARAPFSHGTRTVVEAIIGATNTHANKPFSLVGGGDTVAYVESQGLLEDFNHVSTGGTASLELMAGKKLPGLEALRKK